jgi:hypothetical protein
MEGFGFGKGGLFYLAHDRVGHDSLHLRVLHGPGLPLLHILIAGLPRPHLRTRTPKSKPVRMNELLSVSFGAREESSKYIEEHHHYKSQSSTKQHSWIRLGIQFGSHLNRKNKSIAASRKLAQFTLTNLLTGH